VRAAGPKGGLSCLCRPESQPALRPCPSTGKSNQLHRGQGKQTVDISDAILHKTITFVCLMMQLVTRGQLAHSGSNSHSYSTPDSPSFFLDDLQYGEVRNVNQREKGRHCGQVILRLMQSLEQENVWKIQRQIGDSSEQWGSRTDSV